MVGAAYRFRHGLAVGCRRQGIKNPVAMWQIRHSDLQLNLADLSCRLIWNVSLIRHLKSSSIAVCNTRIRQKGR